MKRKGEDVISYLLYPTILFGLPPFCADGILVMPPTENTFIGTCERRGSFHALITVRQWEEQIKRKKKREDKRKEGEQRREKKRERDRERERD